MLELGKVENFIRIKQVIRKNSQHSSMMLTRSELMTMEFFNLGFRFGITAFGGPKYLMCNNELHVYVV